MCKAAGGALRRDAARRVLDVVRPKGWRVVPKEPTEVMIDVAEENMCAATQTGYDIFASDVYEHMVSIAPSPPLPPKIRDDDPMRETFA